jgi:hypothetical protein
VEVDEEAEEDRDERDERDERGDEAGVENLGLAYEEGKVSRRGERS